MAKPGFATRIQDIGLFKAFCIREDCCLQLWMEASDVFNRQTLGRIQNNVSNVQLGQVASVSGNRAIQNTARFDFWDRSEYATSNFHTACSRHHLVGGQHAAAGRKGVPELGENASVF